MTKAEAWLQCSARGTTVTRLAYIVGCNPSCVEDEGKGGRHLGVKDRKLGVLSSPLVASSSTSSSHHCIIIQLEEQLVRVTKRYTPSRIVLQ